MTPTEFIRKWKPAVLTERAAAQSHFIDLCALVGHEDPVSADPAGEWFAFEKGVTKTGGGDGFADVWKRNHFAWEYKKRKRDLAAALDQLVRYAAALENPPLQVACDTDLILIRTAWTNAVPEEHKIKLEDIVDPANLAILHAVFFDPEKLRPKQSRAALTKEAADKFSTIALRLQGRGKPEDVAHFVNQLVFCFFANSVKLLPEGFFPKLLKRCAQKPERAKDYFNQLFAAMETGGEFDLTDIAWFNGGLFDGRRALPLDSGDIGLLQAAASLDWSQIDPTIFGTLFERFLDPEKRKQIGAHYTDPEKIMMIVEPVILRPLRAEWDAAKAEIEDLLRGKAKPPKGMKRRPPMSLEQTAAEEVRARYIERLKKVTILDPACGSGNFLYLALQGVKDIENRANLESEALGLPPRVNEVGPEILRGIEINPVAAELARTSIWIGDIQWRRRNGFHYDPPPILRRLENIECRDALIERSRESLSHGEEVSPKATDEGMAAFPDRAVAPHPSASSTPSPSERGEGWREAAWLDAEFIVGNPPFLGGKLLRTGLGDAIVETLFEIYAGRVPPEADLVTYWFEKARAQIKLGRAKRAGLVATNSIRGGASRRVLDRLADEVGIFEAWSDEPWIVDGAAVRVSLVCFGANQQGPHLDGRPVSRINPDLTDGALDLTKARRLDENLGVAYMGDTKGGAFDVPGEFARAWLQTPANPNGRRNSEVLKPWRNGQDVARRSVDKWIIDFGWEMSEREASLFEEPFEYAKEHIYPERSRNRREAYRRYWWRHVEPRPALRSKLRKLERYIATPRVAKHRLFVWLPATIVPDSQIIVVARDDDAMFGILHSRFHEAWSLRLGSSLEDRPRYTPTTTFETFPFPDGLTPNTPASDYRNDPLADAIAEAARHLDALRNNWLNPTDIVRKEPEVVPGFPDRVLPRDAAAAVKLRERTLTKLYNERPQWLLDAHNDLDAAVAAAYGWPADISENDALQELLDLNLTRAGTPNIDPDRRFTVEEEALERINAIEGIEPSASMREALADFDADDLSDTKGRRAIAERLKQVAP
jgi:type II restriction/modification system DNA methylase subunit YeeA